MLIEKAVDPVRRVQGNKLNIKPEFDDVTAVDSFKGLPWGGFVSNSWRGNKKCQEN